MKYLPLAFLMLLAGSPFMASAATLQPACAMSATSPSGQHWITFGGTVYVLANPGVPFTVIWGSANASQATDSQGQSIPFVGQQDVTATKTSTYSYTFSAGSSKAVCNVTAVVLSGVSPITVPTSTVPSSTTAPSSSATNSTTGTGAISSNSSFSASMIPLLSGGNAAAGNSIPVTYLKLTNLSTTSSATLPGIWLKQDGTAPDSLVIGFTTVDDKAVSRTNVGGTEGSVLFNAGNLAYVPLNATFTPGQFRIFTVKAQLSGNLSAAHNTTLMLDVSGLDTTGQVAGSFPIRGVTWVLQ